MIKYILGGSMIACAALAAGDASAQTERYIGDVIPNGYNFCPIDTVPANGGLFSIAQYQAAYAVIGTTYGGDGRTSFGMPDLRGRIPLHYGQAPGSSFFQQGARLGSETIVLTEQQLPPHRHVAYAAGEEPDLVSPQDASFPTFPTDVPAYAGDANPTLAMDGDTVGESGNNAPVNIMAPSQVINYCVVLEGLFPPRN
ncbi:MAG: tail fiber protein [Oceanicaulis sp.]